MNGAGVGYNEHRLSKAHPVLHPQFAHLGGLGGIPRYWSSSWRPGLLWGGLILFMAYPGHLVLAPGHLVPSWLGVPWLIFPWIVLIIPVLFALGEENKTRCFVFVAPDG